MKYLTLIRSIALLHQHQRPVKTTTTPSGEEIEYIEVTEADIAIANRLAQEVLGRSLDELPPQTRRLLAGIVDLVTTKCEELGIPKEEYRFTRRDVREWTGVGNTQARVHLNRLEELEYLLVHVGGRGQSRVYELLYEEPQEGSGASFPGLLEIGEPTTSYSYDSNLAGQEGQLAGQIPRLAVGWRGQNGGMAAGGRKSPNVSESLSGKGLEREEKVRFQSSSKKALLGRKDSKPAAVVVIPVENDLEDDEAA
jgi:hypothetical protein